MDAQVTDLWARRVVPALLSVVIVSGCAMAPLGPAVRPAPSAPPAAAGPAAAMPAPMAPDASASGAEQACIAAGRERGLDVMGVVGSRSVNGNDGEAARDVMLRVRRSGAEIEVRCNYVTETRMARIMLI